MTTVTPDWTIRPVPGQLPSRWLGILLHLLVLVHIVFPFSFFFLPTSFWLANWSQDSLELRFFRHRAGRATNFLLTLYQNIALNGRSGLHSMELWQKFSYFFGKLFFFFGFSCPRATNVAKPGRCTCGRKSKFTALQLPVSCLLA